VVAPFSGQVIEGFDIAKDGNSIVLVSRAPLDGDRGPSETARVRFIERSEEGWGEHKPLGHAIRGYPTIAENGNLYLATGDIWISRYIDGEYSEMENLGDSVNTEEFYEEDPFVAPDESYLLFCRRDDGFGAWDIFISFRKDDGSWTEAKNMGETINTSATEVYPFVTPDGKYLFFGSNRTVHADYSETPLTYDEKIAILNSPGNGNHDIYWVDAKVIDELRPPDTGHRDE
jgi:Tol biopolymer transport system component